LHDIGFRVSAFRAFKNSLVVTVLVRWLNCPIGISLLVFCGVYTYRAYRFGVHYGRERHARHAFESNEKVEVLSIKQRAGSADKASVGQKSFSKCDSNLCDDRTQYAPGNIGRKNPYCLVEVQSCREKAP
jgi:hypothetical protein